METRLLTVAKTLLFRRQAEKIWSELEIIALVDHLALNPEDGDVIPGTGGIRKLRWGKAGVGKRGGVRVIYFYYNAGIPLYLLLAYAKAQSSDLTPDEKRSLTKLAAKLKEGKE